jgi:hypothetical protein
MAFLDPDDMLVLEKNKGTVQRIVNDVVEVEIEKIGKIRNRVQFID